MDELLEEGKSILESSITESTYDKRECAAYRLLYRNKQLKEDTKYEIVKDLWAILHTRNQQERYLIRDSIIPSYNKYKEVVYEIPVKEGIQLLSDDTEILNRYIQLYNKVNKRVYDMHYTAIAIQNKAIEEENDELLYDITNSLVLFDKAVIECVATNYVFLKRYVDNSFEMTISEAKDLVINNYEELYVDEII